MSGGVRHLWGCFSKFGCRLQNAALKHKNNQRLRRRQKIETIQANWVVINISYIKLYSKYSKYPSPLNVTRLSTVVTCTRGDTGGRYVLTSMHRFLEEAACLYKLFKSSLLSTVEQPIHSQKKHKINTLYFFIKSVHI